MPDIVGSHNCSQVFVPVVLLPVDRFQDTLAPQGLTSAPNMQVLNALIDTGAQITNITEKAAQKLNLEPDGMARVHGIDGPALKNQYIFKIGFVDLKESELGFRHPHFHLLDAEIEGAEFDCGAGADFDVLLGMDVLSIGTLTITHTGSYKFSF